MKVPLLTTALFCLGFLCEGGRAYGSGFGIFTQGAASLGEADAVVAHTEGPSALFFNPALINEVPGTEVEAGTTLIVPHRRFRPPTGATATTRDAVFYPSTLYLTHAFNERWSAGLALFNPFGLGTDWGGEWAGRYLATNSQLKSYAINPALSWRLLPAVTIAAGFDLVLVDATLESKASSGALGIPGPSFDVNRRFSGSGNGIGYNVGLLADLGGNLALGASYRSPVQVRMDGNLSLSVSSQSVPASASITLPQQVCAGVAYHPEERLTLEVGMRWEDWSSFRELSIDLAGLPQAVYPRNWHDTFAVNAGGKYRLSDAWSVSAGYLHGFNPVPDSTFEPAIPDADADLYCVGAQWRGEKVSLALGYGFQLQRGRTRNANLYGPEATGEYDSYLHLMGVSVGYRF